MVIFFFTQNIFVGQADFFFFTYYVMTSAKLYQWKLDALIPDKNFPRGSESTRRKMLHNNKHRLVLKIILKILGTTNLIIITITLHSVPFRLLPEIPS